MEMMAPNESNTIGVWIGAANGSQYKNAHCDCWEDAQTKAHKAGAQRRSDPSRVFT